MTNFLFLMKQHFFNILHFFHEIPFAIRLNYLSWKYKGGQNIPAHELKNIIDVGDAGEDLHNAIKLVTAIKEICGKLKIKDDETRAYHMLGCYIRNESISLEHSKVVFALLESKNKRSAVFDLMLKEGDINPKLVHLTISPSEFSDFQSWILSDA